MNAIPKQFLENSEDKLYHFTQGEIDQFIQLIREDERFKIKRNERSLSTSLVYWLIELTEHFFSARTECHYSLISERAKRNYSVTTTDYSILKYFDLVAAQPSPGFFKPTKLAYEFLEGKSLIPKYIVGSKGNWKSSSELTNVYNVMANPPNPHWRKLREGDK